MPRRGEESKSEVIVSENVVPDLYAFIQNARFTQTIEEFCGKHAREFESLFEEKDPELSHEHKLIFDDYQNLLEKLFSEFADKHSLSVNDIFECCRDVVEGRYAPLFQEDENAWIVERIMTFMDFDAFLGLMRSELRKSRK